MWASGEVGGEAQKQGIRKSLPSEVTRGTANTLAAWLCLVPWFLRSHKRDLYLSCPPPGLYWARTERKAGALLPMPLQGRTTGACHLWMYCNSVSPSNLVNIISLYVDLRLTKQSDSCLLYWSLVVCVVKQFVPDPLLCSMLSERASVKFEKSVLFWNSVASA